MAGNGRGNGKDHTPLRPNGRDSHIIPPDTGLEQYLLAALLRDNQRLADVGTLGPEHFGYEAHGRIFSVIRHLVGEKLPATPETMAHILAGDPNLATATWNLKTLAASAVSYTPHAVAHYSNELIALAVRRSLMALADDFPRIFLDGKQTSYIDRVEAVRCELNNIFSTLQLAYAPVARLNYLRLEDDEQISRQWLVDGWLPMGETCGLGGAGGEGKTLLAHQLATVAALGYGKWLGMPVTPMKAALLLCEDNTNDSHWRQIKINRRCGCSMQDLDDQLLTMPRREADSNYLAVFDRDNNLQLTDFFHQLLAELKTFGARLVVLDTREDVFNGDQNNPIHARKFVRGVCDRIARELGGIVILVYHPSIRGTNEGDLQSGSVQWNSAYRARLVLTRPAGDDKEDDDTVDTRVLSLIKGNFAAPTEALKINWKNGAFVEKPKAVDDRTQASADRSKAQNEFLDNLEQFTQQGRAVSESKRAGNYAPRMFAAAGTGCSEARLERAMHELFRSGEIEVKGPPEFRNPKIVKVAPHHHNPD